MPKLRAYCADFRRTVTAQNDEMRRPRSAVPPSSCEVESRVAKGFGEHVWLGASHRARPRFGREVGAGRFVVMTTLVVREPDPKLGVERQTHVPCTLCEEAKLLKRLDRSPVRA